MEGYILGVRWHGHALMRLCDPPALYIYGPSLEHRSGSTTDKLLFVFFLQHKPMKDGSFVNFSDFVRGAWLVSLMESAWNEGVFGCLFSYL